MILTIGTDHTLAPLEVRSELFLTKEQRIMLMKRVREQLGAKGAVILSTCNRMELWLSIDEEQGDALLESGQLLQMLTEEMGLRSEDAKLYFVERVDEEAVEHLFHLSCGLKSAIMAEDQIVSQVKEAIAFSRDAGLADNVLEVLFRTAVTAAKKVKSSIHFTRADATAVDSALSLLERQGLELKGIQCMVIGNGEYGKLAASALVARGAKVMVTVRQYHRGRVQVPTGCESVSYADRYQCLDACSIVMSATTSPHFTLASDELPAGWPSHPTTIVDLAVPRDVDPFLGDIEDITLYDIDDFQSGYDAANEEALLRATRLLEEEMAEFWNWLARRDMLGSVASIKDYAERDMYQRMKWKIDRLPLSRAQRDELLAEMDKSCAKVVGKVIFESLEHAGDREGFVEDLSNVAEAAERGFHG